jgi:hypothetical protein
VDVLFGGIQIDRDRVNVYVSGIVENEKLAVPPKMKKHLRPPACHVSEESVKVTLASTVLTFAHVIDIEKCPDLLVVWDPEVPFNILSVWDFNWSKSILIDPSSCFAQILNCSFG